MHVGVVNCNYITSQNKNKPSFKTLIKDKSALPIINQMSEKDKLEFKQIEKRLSKTKFWDLKISSVGDTFREFKFHFIDKKQRHGVISDGFYPYEMQGDTIKIYSIVYGPENTSSNITESLKYKSEDRAEELYNDYFKHLDLIRNRQFNLTPIESLRNKEFELNMLEEAFETPEQEHHLTHISTDIKTKSLIGNNVLDNESNIDLIIK